MIFFSKKNMYFLLLWGVIRALKRLYFWKKATTRPPKHTLGLTDMIKGFERANILLLNNTKLGIKDALYSYESKRNLLNFKDICANSYHIEIIDETYWNKCCDRLFHIFQARSLYLKNNLLSLLEFIIQLWNLSKQIY